jgi:hypothetical protein
LDKGCYSACYRNKLLTDVTGVVFLIGIRTGDLTGLTCLMKLMAVFAILCQPTGIHVTFGMYLFIPYDTNKKDGYYHQQ